MGDALTLTFDQVLSKASGSGCIDLELCQVVP